MFKRKKWLFVSIGMLVCCVGISLFVTAAAVAAPKGKVVAVCRASMGMRGGDPATNGGSSGTAVIALLHEGLGYKANDGKIYPGLAKSWEFDPNWKHITFHLNEKAKWGDGKPVTAEDVKFSIERCMRADLKWVFKGELNRKVDHVEVIDAKTARVHLKQPYPAFMDRASKILVIVPKHYVEKVGDAEFSKKPMGAGPFECIELKQDVVLKVRAKKEHYRKVPHVEFVDLHYIQEDSTRLAMLQAGEADIVMLHPSQINLVQGKPDMRIVWAKYGNVRTLLFFAMAKPDEPPHLLDIRVRKAVAYAIDTKTIAEKLFYGMAEPWGNIVAPYNAGYDPNLKHHPYDPEKAKKLLTEAGYPNGFDTVINNTIVYKLDAQAIQSSLAKVGIRAKLELVEHGIWRKMLQGRKLKCMGVHSTPWWNGRIHPATALSSTFSPGNKFTYTDDDEMAEAFKKLSVMIDEEEMAKQVRLLTKLYHEKMLRINLWAAHSPFGVGKRIKYFGMPPGRVYPVNFEHVTLN